MWVSTQLLLTQSNRPSTVCFSIEAINCPRACIVDIFGSSHCRRRTKLELRDPRTYRCHLKLGWSNTCQADYKGYFMVWCFDENCYVAIISKNLIEATGALLPAFHPWKHSKQARATENSALCSENQIRTCRLGGLYGGQNHRLYGIKDYIGQQKLYWTGTAILESNIVSTKSSARGPFFSFFF